MFSPFPNHCLLLLHLSERLETIIMISEKHWENDEISFQNVYGHREPVNLMIGGMLITYCFCDFLFYGYPCYKRAVMMPEKF